MSSILLADKRRAIRSTPNPLDKATIVSILPKEIDETKATLSPGRFIIPPGTYEKPSVVVVGPSSWFRDIDEEQPLLEIPVSSVVIADSIVKDYCNGLHGCDMAEVMPGLFFIPGEHKVETVVKEHKKLLDRAQVKQRNWYNALIKAADSLWARSNGNPLAISNDMRMAARELQIQRDWMKDFTMVQVVKCPACSTLVSDTVVVCPNCKVVIDKEKFKALGLQFAG